MPTATESTAPTEAGESQQITMEIVGEDPQSAPSQQVPAEPATSGKYILVSLSEQHLYAYENGQLIYSFVASTGMGNSTRVGTFQVLDKIPNAYGANWNIWMPNWMGIYWSGTLENGIHALPILPGGGRLWAGYLGTPISYGCVVLGVDESLQLYDWADVGTTGGNPLVSARRSRGCGENNGPPCERPSGYFDLIVAVFVAVLIVSNVMSSAKIVDLGFSLLGVRMAFDAGTILFPLSYIFGDILTEVYGYRRSRRAIWTGFLCLSLTALVFFVVGRMPGEQTWQGYAGDAAYAAILGGMSTGGIVAGSLAGYWSGEFTNSFVLARMKVLTEGRWLWTRTIGSTILGELVDTSVFVAVASLFRRLSVEPVRHTGADQLPVQGGG